MLTSWIPTPLKDSEPRALAKMFNLSLMCVYLQVLNLKNRKIGNSHIFTHLMAERIGSAASREATAEAWSNSDHPNDQFFGVGRRG